MLSQIVGHYDKLTTSQILFESDLYLDKKSQHWLDKGMSIPNLKSCMIKGMNSYIAALSLF